MCHESEQIRNYVNGALYLLLSYKELMGEARRQHLEQRITELMESQQGQEELNHVSPQSPAVKSDEEKQKHLYTSSLHQFNPHLEEEEEEVQSSIHVQYNYILIKLRG